MKKYIIMGVMVAVLSLGMASVMSVNKPNKAEAQQNQIQKQNTIQQSSSCGCANGAGEGRGYKNRAQRQFIDTNNDGKCDKFVDANNDGKCDNCTR